MKTSTIQASAIRTRILHKGEDIISFLLEHLKDVDLEGKVLAVTSKIVSLAEGQVMAKSLISKRELIQREAEEVIAETVHGVVLTVKEGLFIPSAGIDESNAEGDFYILYPANPAQSVKQIWEQIKTWKNLKNFGVILTDSHTTPLRKGVMGIGLSFYGFKPVNDLVGTPDIFGREMKMTSVNVVDSLASAAVFVMGEAADQCPLAVVNSNHIEFSNKDHSKEISIPLHEDLYGFVFKGR